MKILTFYCFDSKLLNWEILNVFRSTKYRCCSSLVLQLVHLVRSALDYKIKYGR